MFSVSNCRLGHEKPSRPALWPQRKFPLQVRFWEQRWHVEALWLAPWCLLGTRQPGHCHRLQQPQACGYRTWLLDSSLPRRRRLTGKAVPQTPGCGRRWRGPHHCCRLTESPSAGMISSSLCFWSLEMNFGNFSVFRYSSPTADSSTSLALRVANQEKWIVPAAFV